VPTPIHIYIFIKKKTDFCLPMIKNGVTKTNEHIGIPISEQKPKPDTNPNIVARTPAADKYAGDCASGPRTDRQIVATMIITVNVATTSIISIN
jgi:hypothetical protein